MAPDNVENPSALSRIPLQRMTHQVLVKDQREDWAGVTNRRERKKLQNLLNQRAYRKRNPYTTSTGSVPSGEQERTKISREKAKKKRILLGHLAQQALASYMMGQPHLDHLPGLIHLNFLRSLANNADVLQLRVDWLDCNVISPFGFLGPPKPPCPPLVRERRLPENLAPTALQLKMPHHPWIDLFPLPQMRDNFLVATTENLTEEDEIRLWNDMIEHMSDDANNSTGLIVWGESWNVQNWELTETFLRNWGWLLRDCPQILESTNYWRNHRGDDLLTFDK
ncbi:hypothetical protein PFICI_12274 [Pestalotiopsis fici W106-1]|uniref:BZIP domain-containing protein n=1 Tax=Pestalotiopsis fici (strain W106-1 / CGMCC3.15140) TaxID=1229662 RepID=W3WN41_PESFW|nr:uncharacterized protein PFICI_12274 [Pestalotiopsis fici W106-1]ETS75330.1 hypothetical protein PFICI_12274 [Pestalotiopsis fici W106-1]